METKLRQLPEISEDTDMKWSLFRAAKILSNVESCGKKRFRMAAGSEKKAPRRNQDIKEAIPTKKDTFKALLQNRSSTYLQYKYFELRKAAAQRVKMSKEHFWEEFCRRLDSNY